MGDFPFIEWLARDYKRRGEQSHHWTDYVKAHGLANYCLVGDNQLARRKLVYEIETSWYQGKHPLNFTQFEELGGRLKKNLENFREQARTDLNNVNEDLLPADTEVIQTQETLQKLNKFASEVFSVSHSISNQFVSLSKHIITASIDILSRVGETAPCHFAVIALGSVAKGEATPYSDLEYAFVVENENEYFKKLAVDSYFRIGNLMETPLKCFDIQELKADGARTLSLSNSCTVGYRIDGITTNSGNIPTGNGKENGKSLTLTIDGFVQLFKTSAEKPFDGMAGDISDMLSSTELIMTNENGTQHFYDEFCACMNTALLETKNHPVVNHKRVQSFAQDLREYTFLPEFVTFQPPKNLGVKVKVDIFRYPTLLANNIKMCLGVPSKWSWEVLDHLKEKSLLSQAGCDILRIVLALAIYIRTLAYVQKRAQTDQVLISSQRLSHSKSQQLVPAYTFVTIGCFLLPLKQSVTKALLSIADYSHEQSDNFAIKILASMTEPKTNLKTNAEVLYFSGCYPEAVQMLTKSIGEVSSESSPPISCDRFVQLLNGSCGGDQAVVTKYVELYAYLLYHTKAYLVASEVFIWLCSNQPERSGLWNLLIAQCKRELADYKTASKFLKQAKKVLGEARHSETITDMHSNAAVHQDTSESYVRIAAMYNDLGEHNEAQKFNMKALEIYQMLRDGPNEFVVNSEIANCKAYIGKTYCNMAQFATAEQILLESLQMMEDIYKNNSQHPDLANCHLFLGDVASGLGNSRKAMLHYVMALEIYETVFGISGSIMNIADCFSRIAGTHADLGEFTLSLVYYEKSLKIQEFIFGEGARQPTIAMVYGNIGNVFSQQGSFDSAKSSYLVASKIMEEIYGSDANHPSIAKSYTSLGNMYLKFSIFDSALKNFEEALRIYREVYGADANHPDIAHSLNNISIVYSRLGEYASSITLAEHVLNMWESILPHLEHPEIANCYDNLGALYSYRGNYKDALPYHTKALAIRKRIYGNDWNHPDIATGHHNIGTAYSDLGQFDAALEHFTIAITMRKALYGEDANHPKIADSYYNLALVYKDMKLFELALLTYHKALVIRQAVYGATTNHEHIADCLNNIASVCLNLGKADLALEKYTEALEMRKRLYGTDNHPYVANSYANIAGVQVRAGKLAEAETNYLKALNIYRSAYGSDAKHRDIAKLINNLGSLNNTRGHHAVALEYFTAALKMRQDLYGADANHHEIASSHENLGGVYNNLRSFQTALSHFRKSLKMRKIIFGSATNHPEIAKAFLNIGTVFANLGDYHFAMQYYTPALSMLISIESSSRYQHEIGILQDNIRLTVTRLVTAMLPHLFDERWNN